MRSAYGSAIDQTARLPRGYLLGPPAGELHCRDWQCPAERAEGVEESAVVLAGEERLVDGSRRREFVRHCWILPVRCSAASSARASGPREWVTRVAAVARIARGLEIRGLRTSGVLLQARRDGSLVPAYVTLTCAALRAAAGGLCGAATARAWPVSAPDNRAANAMAENVALARALRAVPPAVAAPEGAPARSFGSPSRTGRAGATNGGP